MTSKKLTIDKKELLIAAGAAMTLGLGASAGHSVIVHAATTDNNTSSVAVPSKTTTDSASSTSDAATASSATSNATSTTNSTSTPTKTAFDTTTDDTKTTTDNAGATNSDSSTTTPKVASDATTDTVTQAATKTDTDNSADKTTTSLVQPAASSLTKSTTTADNVTPTTTATPTTTTTPVAPTSTTDPTTTTPAKTITDTKATTLTPVDTSANTISSDGDYTDANKFNWSTDNDGNATLTGTNSNLTSADTNINIPPKITVTNKDTNASTDYNVTAIGNAAFFSNQNINSVQINDGVTDIGDDAFAYTKVTNLDLSNNKTLQNIGKQAFSSDQIKQVQLPDSVETIGDSAFSYNNALTSITLPANLQTIGYQTFAGNTNLASVDFSKATNLQNIGEEAFATDAKLTSIDLSQNNQLTNISKGAFIYDNGLTSVTLPDSLETIGDQAFLADTSLTSMKFGPNLKSIGYQAFTYNDKLTNVDFSNAKALTTIGTGAFEYSNLEGTLTLPANLQTVGEYAFAGNNISNVVLNNGLQTIGNGAFSTNKLTGTLTVPDSVQSIGDSAFSNNQLTGISSNASNFQVGTNAFANNRITTVLLPNVSLDNVNLNGIVDQLAAIFTDSAHNKISDYFNINIGGVTENDLAISDLSNGVTYSDGIFDIPSGTDSFTFTWSLPGTNKYSETYDVVLNDPVIEAINSKVAAGTDWQPSDNFISAKTPDGDTVPFDSITYSIVDPNNQNVTTIDTLKPGTYKVTYKYGSDSSTVTVEVYKRSGTYSLSGTQETTYNGQDQSIDYGNFVVNLSDGSVYTPQNGDLILNTDAKNSGSYQVGLTQQAIDNINNLSQSAYIDWQQSDSTGQLIIQKAPVTITVANASKVAGQADPAFTAEVSMPGVTDGDQVVYNLTRVPGDTVGTYAINASFDPNANPNYSITVVPGTLTITADKQSLVGSNYTMHVGDPTPTASDFQASATDVNGNPLDVKVDLSKADLNTAGTYDVVLSTADGQEKTVQLTVEADPTNGGGTVDPTDPTDPTDPVDPPVVSPVEPVIPDEKDPNNNGTGNNPDDNTNGNVNNNTNGSSSSNVSDVSKNPSESVVNNNSRPEVIMEGNVYYVPGVKGQSNGVLVAPTNLHKNGYDPTNQSGIQTFPQTGNDSGTFMKILGAMIAVLTLGVIDIRKVRH
ncbi:leucine-rich repeat protein [Companilactobacillus farciminis]|uniref:leucine-rich repeat protein n=1 Tax=Companilactobacillus farciminis TaxID=1612 RepID=UPI001915D55D|nr:leucine-rich repeat protein [Companilactobacillus farciminis]